MRAEPIVRGARAARLTAAATGLLLGVGLGILLADGRLWAVVAIPLLALVLWWVVRKLVPTEDRRRVGAIIGLAFALHVAVAVVLFTGSLAAGRGGFIPGDDSEYAYLSGLLVSYLQGHLDPASGPPWWNGEAYLFGTWIYLESAIFYLIGPEVLVPILLNGAFGLGTALLVYDIVRRLFDRQAALVALALTAFYPSLVLWTSLNLKDALALLLIGSCLWALVRFQEQPRWWALALAFAALIPLQSVRVYLFVGLSLLAPVVVAITPRLPATARARWTGAAVLVSAIFLFASQTGLGLGPQLLESFEGTREGMAVGARTAYVPLPPVVVNEGDTFVVPTPVATGTPRVPTATPEAAVVTTPPATSTGSPTVAPTPVPTGAPGVPTATPRASAVTTPPVTSTGSPTVAPTIIHVAPNARIVVATGGPPPPSPSPGTVIVHPGDVVVVGPAGQAPAPTEARRALPVATTPSNTAAPSVTLSSGSASTDVLVKRALSDLPVGAAFALFGPFPWLFERQLDLLVLPETFFWYGCLAAFAATLIRGRYRWQTLAPLYLFVVGLLGLFSVAEGNWGTLFRHRSMVVPWLLALAAPALLLAYRRVKARSATERSIVIA